MVTGKCGKRNYRSEGLITELVDILGIVAFGVLQLESLKSRISLILVQPYSYSEVCKTFHS